jgi:hypothetical protein
LLIQGFAQFYNHAGCPLGRAFGSEKIERMSSDDYEKGNSAAPEGSLKSMPAWQDTRVCSAMPVFFCQRREWSRSIGGMS